MAIVIAVILLVSTFVLTAQAIDAVDKAYTVASGDYLEMKV